MDNVNQKKNVYNAIQNLYNMDFNSWQEVLSLMYNLVSDTSQKFDVFEQRFILSLGIEVTKAIAELYENGSLADYINIDLINDLKNKITNLKDDVYLQLEEKANKNIILTMANMGQDVKENMTNGSVAVVGRNAVLKENLVNGQVTGEKTDFIKNNGNLLNYKYCSDGRLYADGILHLDTEYDTQCYTVDYIEVIANQPVYFSLKNGSNPKAYMGKAFLYNEKMTMDSEITSSIKLDSSGAFATYTPLKNGFIRFSSEKNINSIDRCVSRISKTYIKFEQKLSSDIRIDKLNEYSTLENTISIAKEQAINVVNLHDKLPVGKNKVDVSKSVLGFIDTENGSIAKSNDYKTTDFMFIKKGQSCSISPRCRKFLAYDINNKPIKSSYQSNAISNYTYTAKADGYVKFSYFVSDENIIQLELGSEVTNYEKYCYMSEIPIKAPNINEDKLIKNNLYEKILAGVGDSIMHGDGWRGGFLKLIAENNKMTYHNYGIGGTTIAKRRSETTDTSIVGRIATMPDNVDFILLEGGANDVVKGVPLGEITNGYDTELDEYTFCGAMESMLKQALLKWVGKKIVFITVHKMKSRGDILTTYLEKAKEICEKWCIEVVDIHCMGGLNTNISIYKELYTAGVYTDGTKGDSTHPNKIGYEIFYVPPIEKALK